jgi:general L-amino acid transport system permease protein
MMTWMKRNLFRSVGDSLLTLIFGAVGVYVLWGLLQFVFVTGRWEIIQVNLKLLLVGRFPEELLWLVTGSIMSLAFWVSAAATSSLTKRVAAPKLGLRIWAATQRFGLLIATGLLLIAVSGDSGSIIIGALVVASIVVGQLLGFARRHLAFLGSIPSWIWHLVLASAPIAMVASTLAQASVGLWEGFLINFYIAIISIVLSFPIGVLLALGRRSTLPIIRLVSTTYIELIRGAPLFVLLLLAGVALEFFVPSSLAPDKIFRAVTVFTLFTSAYVAEIVRGGLQSIPRGQTEAGKALGLSTAKITSLVTLPQALRNVIPAQIGQFISLFKDTTLAGVALNVLDLLNVGTAITKQDNYLGQGLIYESLTFVALLFWVGSYVMSRESQRIEKKLGVGQR